MEQKYYKLINQNNIVVDVVDKLKYLRYISDLDKLVTTDKGTSDGIIGSDKKTVYLWVGKKCPPNKPWQHVEVVEIAKTDYNLLKQRLSNNEKIVENTQTLITARKNKINELSTICNETIIKGVNILLTDGLYHSFKMTNEDQINLLQIENEILKNNDEQLFLYHETNQQCKLFSKDDMLIIIT